MLLPYLEANRLEAGCDEVGRGCLSGPVVAAAVILPNGYKNKWINDSKKLTKRNRSELVSEIKENCISWGIAEASIEEIDQINILNASFLAMERAICSLSVVPDHLLIDGNRFKSSLTIPFDCIVKGDGKYVSIAAASILAKVYRDAYMEELAERFPCYGWDKNAGYPTAAHRAAIQSHGASPFHRKSFRLLPDQLKLDL
ncbi:Ribonuclease HII [Lunatimonas lonarensis]|uniref:Ribonuclease HII n=1 Tax=Lunatimonas lonarensis TaxID=1232681 RepID=R7ZL83_9BACT|nr:ribonuclease HII [Lunatimonas lonarensis]EON74794.1 Ribonuclease HII [Lunatimonas lonarensis]